MKRFILYRHFDKNNNLLYIGKSTNFSVRFNGHKQNSLWFDDVYSITIEKFQVAEELSLAEKEAIKKENPIYNKAHNKGKNGGLKLNMQTIKEKIKNQKLDWSGLAKKIGVSRQYISLIKLGENQSHTFKTVEKLAKALELSPLDLIL